MPETDTEQSFSHAPVLLDEVMAWLQPQAGGIFVDATLGLGGHSEALLEASPQTRVIAIDQDAEALGRARARLARFGDRVEFAEANFRELSAVLAARGVLQVRGVLADLGVSSMQLDDAARGFSFAAEAPLDMRMSQGDGESAADLVNRLTESELADLIFEYGEERGARRIARRIVFERERQRLATTKQLAELVVRALRVPGRWRIHPATRTFQALRIAVNDELRALEAFIPAAIAALQPGGRLAIISFHSLEDRIVKRSFQREAGRCLCVGNRRAGGQSPKQQQQQSWETGHYPDADSASSARKDETLVCEQCGSRRRIHPLTRKPVRPGDEEMARNPRARSALLRVCERL